MSADQQIPSVFDERLAEIDRRLRVIQSDLVPAPPPARTPLRPAAEEPAAQEAESEQLDSSSPSELVAQLQDLIDFHQRLLTSTAELLEAYADALAHGPELPEHPEPHPLPGPRQPTRPTTITLATGPLRSTDALRDFQRRLEELPGVREVVVREFEGDDRAVVDVHLSVSTS